MGEERAEGSRDCIRHLSLRPHTLVPSIEDLAVCVVFYGLLPFVMPSRMPSRKTFQAVFKHNSCFYTSFLYLLPYLFLSLLSIGSSALFPFMSFLLVLCLSFGKVDATSRTTQGHFKIEETEDRGEFESKTRDKKERKRERNRGI